MSKFVVPEINDNPNGWGPTSIPEQFADVPFSFFNKAEKLGKVSDFTGNTRQYGQRYNRPASAADQEDESFQTVTRPTATKTQAQSRYGRYGQQQRVGMRGGRMQHARGVQKTPYGAQNKFKKGAYTKSYRPRARQASVDVKPDWNVIAQFSFSELSKLSINDVPAVEDIKQCGFTENYNKEYDRITTKTEKPLERFDERTFFRVTTTDDPVIRELASQGAGNVFATDTILSALMCASRSVYSWDILINKVGGVIFFDKRESSDFDLLTVNETSSEQPVDDKDGINSSAALSEEATFINQNFSQQVLIKGQRYNFPEPNPFQSEGEEVAAVGYRYRKFTISDDITLIARCEVDGVVKQPKGEPKYLSIKALNQYDPLVSKVDWRQKLDTQRGAILAAEIKNNANKIARWTSQALLSGADQIKLGYVSRVNARNPYEHSILGVETLKPTEFAKSINLSVQNMWGIFLQIIKELNKVGDGKFVLLKDPNKPTIRLYEVPEDAFEELEAGGAVEEDEEESLMESDSVITEEESIEAEDPEFPDEVAPVDSTI